MAAMLLLTPSSGLAEEGPAPEELAAEMVRAGQAMAGLHGQPGPDRVDGPVAATLVRVVDATTLIVRARPWPQMEILTTVRLEGAGMPADPADARLAAAMIGAAGALSPQLRLYGVRPAADGPAIVARVVTGDGRDLSALAAGLP